MYSSKVETVISAAHHNGPPGHKCNTNHGHEWAITVQFRYTDAHLNAYGWGPDFGEVKRIIREFDHGDLNELVPEPYHPSAEGLARLLYNRLAAQLFEPASVTIAEGQGNEVTYSE